VTVDEHAVNEVLRISELLIDVGSDERTHEPPREWLPRAGGRPYGPSLPGSMPAGTSARGWLEIIYTQEGIQQEDICVTVAARPALTVEEEP